VASLQAVMSRCLIRFECVVPLKGAYRSHWLDHRRHRRRDIPYRSFVIGICQKDSDRTANVNNSTNITSVLWNRCSKVLLLLTFLARRGIVVLRLKVKMFRNNWYWTHTKETFYTFYILFPVFVSFSYQLLYYRYFLTNSAKI